MLDKRLLGLAKQQRTALLATIGCGMLSALVLIAQAGVLTRVIGRVFLGHDALAQVFALLLLLLVLALVRAVLLWTAELSAQHIATGAKTALRQRVVGHVLALGPAFVRGERSGELANTAVMGVEELDAWYSQYLPQVVLSMLVPLLILVAAFIIDPLTGLILLLTAPLIPVFMMLIGHLASSLTQRQWRSLSHMSAHFLDVLQGLSTLKLFGRSQRQVATIERISDDFRRATLRVLRVAFLSALVLELVATLSTAVIAVEVGVRLLGGTIDFGRAFFVLLLTPEFYQPLRALGAKFHASMSGKAAADRAFELLETPLPAPATAQGTTMAPIPAAPLSIALRNVHYSYAADETPALDGVSLTIPAGKMVALVGESGAGKSTLASLLLRFMEPASGAILVNDTSLALTDAREWRQHVAWVPQRPHLFHGTIAENIALGQPDASRLDIIAAAMAASAHEFVESLPQGYDTQVGEQGTRLSGGQVQRIALARAFLRDAPLVVLDEPTSQLDTANEDVIRRAMRQLLVGRTALVIAHRLTTVSEADLIAVMDRGHISGVGTHAQLLHTNHIYTNLVTVYGATT